MAKKPKRGGDAPDEDETLGAENTVQNADGDEKHASRIVWLISQLPSDQRRVIAAEYNKLRDDDPDNAPAYGDWLLEHHRAHLDAWLTLHPEQAGEEDKAPAAE